MSTSFNRNRAQLRLENLVGCSDLANWKNYKSALESYIITDVDETYLKADLIDDSRDFYYMGLLSLSEGVNSVLNSRYSWATVKLYYSIYYFLRASLAIRGYALIRNQSLYITKASAGARVTKKVGREYNSTHSGTIHLYKDIFETVDKLQSNSIAGINPYLWLMDKREQVNYRERCFHDPLFANFWAKIGNYQQKGNDMFGLIADYYKDSRFIFCFLEDDAMLALPIKRSILTKDDFKLLGIPMGLTAHQKELVSKLIHIEKLAEFLPLLG